MNILEVKQNLARAIETNMNLQTEGVTPISYSISGPPGIGKTEAVEQLVSQLGGRCITLSLSQLDEIGDLVGFPLKEYEVIDDGVAKWVTEGEIINYKSTGKNRMSYAAPEWVEGVENNGKPNVLFLDDFTRCPSNLLNPVMEIINQQKYVSWELPKNWTVVLSENPDDGTMNVNSMDDAQKSRYIAWDVNYDNKIWCQWAEIAGIDGRAINFMIKHGDDIITDKNPHINARILTKFFNSIKYIKDFNNINDLNYIRIQAKGSVDESFAELFISFIRDGLDKLISPEEMLLTSKHENAIKKIKENIWDGNTEKVHVASILALRFGNYCVKYSKDNKFTKDNYERIYTIYKEKDMFRNDLQYALISKLFNGHQRTFERLFSMYPDLVTDILK